MGRLIPVRAYAIAGTLVPREVEGAFSGGTRLRCTKTLLLVSFGGDAYAVAHDFGAVVFFDVPAERCEAAMATLLAAAPAEPGPPRVEGFAVEILPGAPLQAGFDRVIAPELTVPLVELVALVVAQSVAMEYYEDAVDRLFRALSQRSTALARLGRIRGGQRELLRFIGEAMATRNQVVFTLALLDSPLVAWDDEALGKAYRHLRASFEIEDRYRSLDHKLGTIQGNLELFVDMVRHRRSVLLELLVIALIFVEVVLFVWSLDRGH